MAHTGATGVTSGKRGGESIVGGAPESYRGGGGRCVP